jgi:Trypsin-like serine proteases, typically periplasmic, contain C-terminal PDZ domain
MSKATTIIAALSLVIALFLLLEVITFQQQIESVASELSKVRWQLEALSKRLETIDQSVRTLESSELQEPQVHVSAPSNITLIYEKVKDSVVKISVISFVGEVVGSGFIYDSQGHVVTNNHVVEGGERFYVYFLDGSAYEASLVGRDPDSDLAVLRLVLGGKSPTLKPLKLGNSSELRIGEQIIVIGNPFELAGTVTTGIVSQKGRLLPSGRGYLIPSVIQIDAAINPGNSGGPVLNLKGEVVGVATAIESVTGQFAGIGYAVSSNVVKRIVPALIENGRYRYSYLGITGSEINELVANALGVDVKKGLLVESVASSGPAARAGIRGGTRTLQVAGKSYLVGGDIIVGINGTPVNSMDDLLTYLVERTSPGDLIVLTIIRDGSRIDVPVTLGERP